MTSSPSNPDRGGIEDSRTPIPGLPVKHHSGIGVSLFKLRFNAHPRSLSPTFYARLDTQKFSGTPFAYKTYLHCSRKKKEQDKSATERTCVKFHVEDGQVRKATGNVRQPDTFLSPLSGSQQQGGKRNVVLGMAASSTALHASGPRIETSGWGCDGRGQAGGVGAASAACHPCPVPDGPPEPGKERGPASPWHFCVCFLFLAGLHRLWSLFPMSAHSKLLTVNTADGMPATEEATEHSFGQWWLFLL